MKTASAYKSPCEGEKQFLSGIAKDVATLVTKPKKMDYFRKQIREFGEKWKAHRKTHQADRKGKWQPSMGKPSNPLGTIWPAAYGSGWGDDIARERKPSYGVHVVPPPCVAYPPMLSAYALLSVIHDNIPSHCPSIAREILPKELAREIWRNLVTGRLQEDGMERIPKLIIENCLRDVKADIESHFAPKKSTTQKLAASSDLASEQQKKAEPPPPASGGEKTDSADLAKVPISELIKQGESHTLEFKETLEYDTQKQEKNKDILHSSLKTIAGFLNAAGGTLLIGVVNDSGEIRGIERDLSTMNHGNNDRFELKIRNCLKDRFKPQPIGKVNISFEKFTEGTICRVDVQASKEIVNLDGEVYVRDGNTTQLLKGRDLTDWIQQRVQTANIGNGS